MKLTNSVINLSFAATRVSILNLYLSVAMPLPISYIQALTQNSALITVWPSLSRAEEGSKFSGLINQQEKFSMIKIKFYGGLLK